MITDERRKRGEHLLTHSRMRCFQLCRRKYLYQYVYGFRREPGEALRMGAMVHQALHWLNCKTDIDAVIQGITRNYQPMIDLAETVEYAEAIELEAERCRRLIEGYVRLWDGSDIKIVESEELFEFPLVNPRTGRKNRNYRLAGRIDGICRTYEDRLMVLEHKTTGDSLDSDSSFWTASRIDTQITLYMLAARHLGFNVQGVVYDVIRKPSIAPKLIGKGNGRNRESVAEYGERLAADLGERPHFYFQRREIPRFDSELAELQEEAWQVAKDIHQADKRSQHYRNSAACAAMYPCEFLDICANRVNLLADPLPTGFTRIDYLHPELLERDNDDSTTTGETDTASETNTDPGGDGWGGPGGEQRNVAET